MNLPSLMSRVFAAAAFAALPLLGTACERNDMHNQPRYEPMEASALFTDGQSARPMVPGTIARGQLVSNNMRFSGLPQGPTPETFPFPITKADLVRGQQRFEIYCGVCHGAGGDGDGMIVQRGFVKPPSFHDQRLKDVPVGHFFDVITNGWGAMYSYSDRIFPEDRWRIAAYIRVLQLSQEKAIAAAPNAPRSMAGTGAPGNPAGASDREHQQQAPQTNPQQPLAAPQQPSPPQPGAQ